MYPFYLHVLAETVVLRSRHAVGVKERAVVAFGLLLFLGVVETSFSEIGLK